MSCVSLRVRALVIAANRRTDALVCSRSATCAALSAVDVGERVSETAAHACEPLGARDIPGSGVRKPEHHWPVFIPGHLPGDRLKPAVEGSDRPGTLDRRTDKEAPLAVGECRFSSLKRNEFESSVWNWTPGVVENLAFERCGLIAHRRASTSGAVAHDAHPQHRVGTGGCAGLNPQLIHSRPIEPA